MHRYEHAESTATPDTTVESTWGSQMPPLPPVMPGLVLHDGFLEDEALEMPEDRLDRQEISGFIRDLVRGRTLPVLAVNGTAVECLVAMDKQLRYMVIQRTGKKEAKRRALALETVDQICVGTEALEDSGLPLTEMCVCLLLTEGQAVAFVFQNLRERDLFASTLSMFVDQRQQILRESVRLSKMSAAPQESTLPLAPISRHVQPDDAGRCRVLETTKLLKNSKKLQKCRSGF